MEENKKEIEEKIVDIKGTFESFIEEELPEISQQEEIELYDGKTDTIKRKRKSSTEDAENEDDEHIKRVKKELLASLERVDKMEKKIFSEKQKKSIKDLKTKKTKEQMKEIYINNKVDKITDKAKNIIERSREE